MKPHRATAALVLALTLSFVSRPQLARAQAPPFSYRGVYEATLVSGAKIVFFVSNDSDVSDRAGFLYLDVSRQIVANGDAAIDVSGNTSFVTSAGTVTATFRPSGVSGSVGGQNFNSSRTALSSVQGSLQGAYSGTLWFPDGSLNYVGYILTPAGNFYAFASTTSGAQGGIGTWSENGAFSGTGIPGAVPFSGSGTLNSGVFSGTYFAPGLGTARFFAAKENTINHLINISTRAFVGTGANQAIAGFVIRNGAKRVLIRVLGPSLTAVGVAGAISDPFLTLYSGSTVIATNDSWSVGNDVAAVTATGFAPTDGRECILLVSLQPGAYTAIVSGVGGSTGVALVEVYEID